MKRLATVLALTAALSVPAVTLPADVPLGVSAAQAVPSWSACRVHSFYGQNYRRVYEVSIDYGTFRRCLYRVDRRSWKTLGLWKYQGYTSRHLR